MIVNLNEADYSYDKLNKAALGLAKQYDKIVKNVTIGQSHDNRDIFLIKLGVGQRYFVCCGGVHARETINPAVLLRIIEYYADLYSNFRRLKSNFIQMLGSPNPHLQEEYEQMLYGACIYELLQTFTILFIPLLNPDGYMIAQQGFDAIRDNQLRQQCENMQIPHTEWKGNARGVDLNRNFPSLLWKPKSDTDTPASENETKALLQVFQSFKTRGFLDFHSRGKSIYYYRNRMTDSYNKRQLMIAQRLKEITNYELELPEEEIDTGDSGGNTVHYYSEHFRKPALTIETVEEEATFPLSGQYREETFEELKFVISEFGSMIV
jgi:g-D-glutamyl-meso-diaminopimelate peptidase